MKYLSVFLVAAFICLFPIANLSAEQPEWDRGDFYGVKIFAPDLAKQLKSQGIRTRDRLGDEIVVRINDEEKQRLERLGYILRSLPGNPAISRTRSLNSCSTFPQHSEVVSTLNSLVDDYPAIARRITLGYSVENREIAGIVISDNVAVEEDEPEVRLLGAHHGDECMSVEIPLRMARYLCENYGLEGQDRITEMVDSLQIMIAPLVNPDGNDSSDGYSSRYNANGIDINRNYGYQWRNDNEEGKAITEPEVRAVIEEGLQSNYVVSFSYHTYGDYVNYPWNMGYSSGTTYPAVDDSSLFYLSNRYNFHTGNSYTVTNGAEWYVTNGDTNDWSYGTRGDFDWTIELSDSSPDVVWDKNDGGILECFEHAQRGVRGVVTDTDTGEPLEAMILVDDPHWQVYTDPQVGDYHRFLMPGTYSFTVWAPGYLPERVENVVVDDGPAVRQDVTLEAGGRYCALQVLTVVTDITSSDDTYPVEAFGEPDGSGFILKEIDDYWFSTQGYIVLDMGLEMSNLEGPDLYVYEADPQPGRSYKVYVSDDYAPEQWSYIGSGNGSQAFELGAAARVNPRYIRIMDDIAAGEFTLDAVEYAPEIEDGDIDGDVDTDPELEPDVDEVDGDVDFDDEPDVDEDIDIVDGDADDEIEIVEEQESGGDEDTLESDGEDVTCLKSSDIKCWSILVEDEKECLSTNILARPELSACNTIMLPYCELCGMEVFSVALEWDGQLWHGPQDLAKGTECLIGPEVDKGELALEGDCGFNATQAVVISYVDCGELEEGEALCDNDCDGCAEDGDSVEDGDDSEGGDSETNGDDGKDDDNDDDDNDDDSEDKGSGDSGCNSSGQASWFILLMLAGFVAMRRRFSM